MSDELDWEVKEVPVDKLHENPLNPNVLSDSQEEELEHSIKEYEFSQFPCVSPREDGEYDIIDGAHRTKKAKKLGKDKIKVVVIKGLSDVAVHGGIFLINKARGKIDSDVQDEIIQQMDKDYSERPSGDELEKAKQLANGGGNGGNGSGGGNAPQMRSGRGTWSGTSVNNAVVPITFHIPEKDEDFVDETLDMVSSNRADAILKLAKYVGDKNDK